MQYREEKINSKWVKRHSRINGLCTLVSFVISPEVEKGKGMLPFQAVLENVYRFSHVCQQVRDGRYRTMTMMIIIIMMMAVTLKPSISLCNMLRSIKRLT